MISFEDQRELESLISRFVHATDRRDYALLRSLYTDDGIDNHGDYNGPVDGFITWLEQVQSYFDMSTHMMSNLLFAVDGDTAESEGRGTAYLALKGDGQPFNMIVVSRHFDQYRRVDGRWLFSCRSFCVDWVQQFAPGSGSLDIVAASPMGSMGPQDHVYQKVSKLIAQVRSGLPPIA